MAIIPGTIKHRHQSTLPPGNSDIDVDEWNDSLVVAGGSTGYLLTRDPTQTDGWGLTDKVPVANGGTGVAVLNPAQGVLVANGSSPITVTGAGATGDVLTSSGNPSVAPSFQTPVAASSRCSVYHLGTQSVASGVLVTCLFNTEEWDVGNLHAAGSDTITIPVTGGYLVLGQVTYSSQAGGNRYAQLRITGSPVANNIMAGHAAGLNIVPFTPTVFALSAGAAITLGAFQDSGQTLTSGDATYRQNSNWLQVIRLW